MTSLRLPISRIVLILWLSFPVALRAQNRAGDAALPKHQPQRRVGFFDYYLGKINPDGKDYGGELRSTRATVVEKSVDDIYFWSNGISLLLLVTVTVLFFLHLRSSNKKEFITAVLLTELWNRSVSDRIELQTRTEEFNQLASRYSAESARALVESVPEEDEKKSISKLQRTIDHVAQRPSKTGDAARIGTDTLVALRTASHDVTAVNLQERVVLLQKRIAEMKKVEQNLKEQVNRKDALLDQSERRNRTLKGA